MRRLYLLLTALPVLGLLAFSLASASAAPPTIPNTSFSSVREESVVLEGEISPGERVSKYHFEYGTADCSSNPCTSVPVPDGTVPKGNVPVLVKAEAGGLQDGTTYHFRLIATNPDGKAESPDKTFKTFITPPPFSACPNDGLRLQNPMAAFIEYSSANLPDCRAYEQASPKDKDGSGATGTIAWVKASPSGDAISFLTTSGMPGAEGAQQELPTWLASRGAGSWSTQGLFVPATSGQSVRVRGWLPDFSRVFEYARQEGPPQKAAFLARKSTDRSLEEITPYHSFPAEPSYSFVGAGTDGQTVIFESNEALAPEAIAGNSNVYAWDPSTHALRLVSRLPDGECPTAPCGPAAGAFAGAYAWIEQPAPAVEGDAVTKQGGAAFGNYNQDLHAISSDGRYAYFTAAETGRLYVRINPTKEQSPLEPSGKCKDSELACTLRVSASRKANGGGEGGTDAAGPRPAAFMVASADGKTAFFTSPEKLTDNSNTGPEPQAPTISRAAISGEPTSVEQKFILGKALGLAVDGTHIYWANPGDDSIGRAKLNGEGAASEIEAEFITGADNPRYVAVDGTHVYWTNAADEKDGTGTIGRAKLGLAGAEEVEEEFITGASNPKGIAVDATHVYWANAGSELVTRTIGRAKLGPSDAEEINQNFIQIDTGSQELIPQGVAVNGTHIYIAESAAVGSFVVRFDLDGDPSTQKFVFDTSVKPSAQGIALDAGHVYWARQGGDAIGRINLALEKGSAEEEFIKNAEHPIGLAADAGHIYWSANQEVVPNPGNDLYRFDAETKALEDLTPDASSKNGAEVKGVLGASWDGSHVYFAANGVLAPGATPGNCEGRALSGTLNYSGECNLYLYREGAPQPLLFIQRLDANGGGSDAVNWLPARPTESLQKASRVSTDGQTLLFVSQLDLGGKKGFPKLYRYRVGQGTTCISCSPTEAPSGGATLGSIAPPFLGPIRTAAVLSRNLSADGNRIFFETTAPLVATDTNGDEGCPGKGTENVSFPVCQDVYEWEAKGTGSCEWEAQNGGCLYLLTTGKSQEASFFGDASADGSDVFVFTLAKLVGQDQDQLVDVYSASENGGLASQSQPPPPTCQSAEACHEPVGPAPNFESPGSESFSGPGNPKSKQSCPKGKRKVRSKGKVRCVAKHKGKGRKQANEQKKGRIAR